MQVIAGRPVDNEAAMRHRARRRGTTAAEKLGFTKICNPVILIACCIRVLLNFFFVCTPNPYSSLSDAEAALGGLSDGPGCGRRRLHSHYWDLEIAAAARRVSVSPQAAP